MVGGCVGSRRKREKGVGPVRVCVFGLLCWLKGGRVGRGGAGSVLKGDYVGTCIWGLLVVERERCGGTHHDV